jgi:hypothetical protein
VQRLAVLWGLITVSITLAGSLRGHAEPLRADTSRAELAQLGQEYGDLRVWASAIGNAADTLPASNTEAARVLADQLARLLRPLEQDFERTTAALSTAQLEAVLPLWERMAFAHAGLVMLQEQADSLGGDPGLDPTALHDLVDQLSGVLDFASDIQEQVLDRLTTPPPTPIRAI